LQPPTYLASRKTCMGLPEVSITTWSRLFVSGRTSVTTFCITARGLLPTLLQYHWESLLTPRVVVAVVVLTFRKCGERRRKEADVAWRQEIPLVSLLAQYFYEMPHGSAYFHSLGLPLRIISTDSDPAILRRYSVVISAGFLTFLWQISWFGEARLGTNNTLRM
jgi:hypothetical protein